MIFNLLFRISIKLDDLVIILWYFLCMKNILYDFDSINIILCCNVQITIYGEYKYKYILNKYSQLYELGIPYYMKYYS